MRNAMTTLEEIATLGSGNWGNGEVVSSNASIAVHHRPGSAKSVEFRVPTRARTGKLGPQIQTDERASELARHSYDKPWMSGRAMYRLP